MVLINDANDFSKYKLYAMHQKTMPTGINPGLSGFGFQKRSDASRQTRQHSLMQSASIRKWLLALTLLAVILWTIVHFYNQSTQRTGNIKAIVLEPQGDFSYRTTNNPLAG